MSDVSELTQVSPSAARGDTLSGAEARIFRSIPTDVRSVLSDDQLQRLIWSVKPVPTRHGLAIRSSFRFFAKRYYVALFAGEDCRSIERLQAEGQTDAIPVGITFFLIAGLIVIYGLFPLAILLYLVKTMLGIDFTDGPSDLHLWFCG